MRTSQSPKTKTNKSLRPFDPKTDERLLCEGEREAFRLSYPGSVYPFDSAHRRLESIQMEQSVAYTLLDKGRPIGFVVGRLEFFYANPVGYVESVYLVSDHRGKGNLSLLLNELGRRFADVGAAKMQLDVTASNDQALAAYEAYGFEVSRHQMEFNLNPNSL